MKLKQVFERLKPETEDPRTAHFRGVIAMDRYPLVYYNVPKCACTTIKNVMYQLEYGEPFPEPLDVHRSIATGRVLVGRHQPERLLTALATRRISFTFVRHPLRRAYSCFNEKIFQESAHSFRDLRNGVLRDTFGIRFPAEGEPYDAAAHARNFARFLEFVGQNAAGQTEVRQDAHWLPQATIIQRQRNRGEIDFVGRLESYRDDFAFVLRKAGVTDIDPLVDLRYNEGLPPPHGYGDILTDEVLDLGARVYAEDYERFAYDPTAR